MICCDVNNLTMVIAQYQLTIASANRPLSRSGERND